MSRPVYEERRRDRPEKEERRRNRRDKIARRQMAQETGWLPAYR